MVIQNQKIQGGGAYMFSSCNNLFEKICVIASGVSIILIMGLGIYFVGVILNLGYFWAFCTQIIIALIIVKFDEIYRRHIINEYKAKLDYEKRRDDYFFK